MRNTHIINESHIVHRKLATAFSNAVALGILPLKLGR